MSDLISRQKVMWILTNLSYTQCKTQGEAEVIETAKTLVITMPSTQPERCEDCVNFSKTRLLIPQPEIIRCGQCKYAEVADQEDSQDGYTCQFHRGSIWFSGSYCSWAERRADG